MDNIRYEILEDGTITLETEGVSGKNHVSADELVKQIGKFMGGEMKVKKKKAHAKHTHHNHNHAKH